MGIPYHVAEGKMMDQQGFNTIAWNSGNPQAYGYGLRVSKKDRDSHLKREWKKVEIYLPNSDEPIPVNIDKNSFWNGTCRELISADIGRWLLNTGLAPWPKGSPPRVRLVPRGAGAFDAHPSTAPAIKQSETEVATGHP
jgi:hypothetical protein